MVRGEPKARGHSRKLSKTSLRRGEGVRKEAFLEQQNNEYWNQPNKDEVNLVSIAKFLRLVNRNERS